MRLSKPAPNAGFLFNNMFSIFNNFLNNLEYQLLPTACATCGRSGTSFCPHCRAHILRKPRCCPLCGRNNQLGLFCVNCQTIAKNYAFSGIYAYGNYRQATLQTAIKACKDRGVKDIGYKLGKMLGRALKADWQQAPPAWQITTPHIIPIPLHPRRQRERGFNQSDLLAAGLSQASGWAWSKQLQRLKYRQTSSYLSDNRRQEQAPIFVCPKNALNGQTIILVDDIVSTGATAQAASIALKQAGANNILVAVMAQVS